MVIHHVYFAFLLSTSSFSQNQDQNRYGRQDIRHTAKCQTHWLYLQRMVYRKIRRQENYQILEGKYFQEHHTVCTLEKSRPARQCQETIRQKYKEEHA